MPTPKQKTSRILWSILAALFVGIDGMLKPASLWLFFVLVFILALFAAACFAFVGYLIGFAPSGGE